jgi:integrase
LPKLTKRVVDALQPGERDVFVWDNELHGFGVRVKPSGAGAFIIQYRTETGRTRRFALGRKGTLTPDEARRMARDQLAAVAHGGDPSRERRQAKAAITVNDLLDAYLEAARAGLVITRFRQKKRDSTVAIDEGRIARHIRPLIGAELAAKLTRADVQKMHDAVAAGKTSGVFKGKPRGKAIVTGGPVTATRVVGLLGGIWGWGAKRGLVPGPNPAHGVETAAGRAKDRVLKPNELKALGATLAENEAVQPQAVAAIWIIALTGMRRSEACHLRWDAIDAASSRLRESKTGSSIRPLGRAALDVIEAIGDEADRGEWLFPNRSESGPMEMKATIARLFDEAGLTDVRAHDLRRTYTSTAANLGYSDSTIAELIGHARRGVTHRHYIRRPDAALIEAANNVSAQIAGYLNGKTSDDKADTAVQEEAAE